MASPALPKACIIGAGCSGFTTAKRLEGRRRALRAASRPPTSAATGTTRTPTGCRPATRACTSTPPSGGWPSRTFRSRPTGPTSPHHSQVLGSTSRTTWPISACATTITFNTKVRGRAHPAAACRSVTLSTARRAAYDVLIVANGHHWDPRTPEYPGHVRRPSLPRPRLQRPVRSGRHARQDRGGGRHGQFGHGYRQRTGPAPDRRQADRLGPARGLGVPEISERQAVGQVGHAAVDAAQAGAEDRPLADPQARGPDGGLRPAQARPRAAGSPPSVSGEFLTRAGCGDITFKPAIKALEGKSVRFADDSVEPVDVIVFATGYKISFPFLDDPALVPDANHRLPLFKRMMKPGVPDLFYMGSGPGPADPGQFRRAAVQAGRRLPDRPLRPALGRRDGAASRPRTRSATPASTTPRPATRSRSTSGSIAPT